MAVTILDGGCLICSRPSSDHVTMQALNDGLQVECPQCGQYESSVGRQAFERLPPELRTGLSCAARQAFEAGQRLKITTANAKEIAEPHFGTRVADNQERLLREVATKAGRPPNGAWFSFLTDFTLIDCQSSEEFSWYVEWLIRS